MQTPGTKKRLIVIAGPTASGKTAVSIEVARHFDAPVLSCDSRQFYREIPIGTAAPTATEQSGVPHYFVGERSVTEFYSCGAFERDALKLLDELFAGRDTVVMVGGSGLYADAVCEGIDDIPAVDPALRPALQARLKAGGLAPLVAELERLDPEYAARVDRRNPARVIRALEICMGTGQTYTALRRGAAKARPFEVVRVGVTRPRAELYERIDRRVGAMFEAGLEAEARAVYPLREHNALRTVGYRELFDHFDGKTTREEAAALIRRNSRRYAKRQLTWFARDPRIAWFDGDEIEKIIEYLDSLPLPVR